MPIERAPRNIWETVRAIAALSSRRNRRLARVATSASLAIAAKSRRLELRLERDLTASAQRLGRERDLARERAVELDVQRLRAWVGRAGGRVDVDGAGSRLTGGRLDQGIDGPERLSFGRPAVLP